MSGHYIKKCKYCKIAMGQCRCPAQNKEIRYSVCEKCKKEMKDKDSKK